MHAIRISEHGDAKVLHYEEVPVPEPKEGEARVKIQAIGVNFTDIYHRKGLYKLTLPATIGVEAAGVVDKLGPGVTDLRPGQRVACSALTGAYAEYAVGPAWKLVPVPEGITSEQAAAVMLQGMTAHYLSHSTFPLESGHTALVHAAAGGVGLLLDQIAKRRGARVIGTVSTEEKARLAKEAGADDVILYTQQDFEAEAKRLTGGKGVDVVYDSVGKTTFEKGLNVLKPRGHMVLYGQSSGPVGPFDPQVLNTKGSLFLTRPTLATYTASRDELMRRAQDLFTWMLAGKLNVRIDRTFPLAQAAEAQQCLESRQSKGKLLLIP